MVVVRRKSNDRCLTASRSTGQPANWDRPPTHSQLAKFIGRDRVAHGGNFTWRSKLAYWIGTKDPIMLRIFRLQPTHLPGMLSRR